MNPFKRILVDVDATASAHPALQRGILLARSLDATLTIVDVLTIPPDARHYFPPALEESMIRERRQQLAAVANEVKDVRVESKLLVGRPATVLIQEVLRAGHDLLIRSHAHEIAASGPKAFGAVDMELLRKCPCPVLLVRHGSPASHPRIVAAVNASTGDGEEQRMNAKIVETALLMAAHLDAGPPRLLQAWMPFGERIARTHSADHQFASYVESARRRAETDLARLVQSFDGRLAAPPSALRRGKAEDVIPEFVVAEGVDLVVMGTVARAGVAGMLIGNTAERVLRKLPSSVLTVKPDGFVTPVPPAAPDSAT